MDKLKDLVEEMEKLLEPVKVKADITIIVALDGEQNDGKAVYAIFGNLPEGKNQEMVRVVALDLAMREVLDMARAMQELSELVGKVN